MTFSPIHKGPGSHAGPGLSGGALTSGGPGIGQSPTRQPALVPDVIGGGAAFTMQSRADAALHHHLLAGSSLAAAFAAAKRGSVICYVSDGSEVLTADITAVTADDFAEHLNGLAARDPAQRDRAVLMTLHRDTPRNAFLLDSLRAAVEESDWRAPVILQRADGERIVQWTPAGADGSLAQVQFEVSTPMKLGHCVTMWQKHLRAIVRDETIVITIHDTLDHARKGDRKKWSQSLQKNLERLRDSGLLRVTIRDTQGEVATLQAGTITSSRGLLNDQSAAAPAAAISPARATRLYEKPFSRSAQRAQRIPWDPPMWTLVAGSKPESLREQEPLRRIHLSDELARVPADCPVAIEGMRGLKHFYPDQTFLSLSRTAQVDIIQSGEKTATVRLMTLWYHPELARLARADVFVDGAYLELGLRHLTEYHRQQSSQHHEYILGDPPIPTVIVIEHVAGMDKPQRLPKLARDYVAAMRVIGHRDITIVYKNKVIAASRKGVEFRRGLAPHSAAGSTAATGTSPGGGQSGNGAATNPQPTGAAASAAGTTVVPTPPDEIDPATLPLPASFFRELPTGHYEPARPVTTALPAGPSAISLNRRGVTARPELRAPDGSALSQVDASNELRRLVHAHTEKPVLVKLDGWNTRELLTLAVTETFGECIVLEDGHTYFLVTQMVDATTGELRGLSFHRGSEFRVGQLVDTLIKAARSQKIGRIVRALGLTIVFPDFAGTISRAKQEWAEEAVYWLRVAGCAQVTMVTMDGQVFAASDALPDDIATRSEARFALSLPPSTAERHSVPTTDVAVATEFMINLIPTLRGPAVIDVGSDVDLASALFDVLWTRQGAQIPDDLFLQVGDEIALHATVDPAAQRVTSVEINGSVLSKAILAPWLGRAVSFPVVVRCMSPADGFALQSLFPVLDTATDAMPHAPAPYVTTPTREFEFGRLATIGRWTHRVRAIAAWYGLQVTFEECAAVAQSIPTFSGIEPHTDIMRAVIEFTSQPGPAGVDVRRMSEYGTPLPSTVVGLVMRYLLERRANAALLALGREVQLDIDSRQGVSLGKAARLGLLPALWEPESDRRTRAFRRAMTHPRAADAHPPARLLFEIVCSPSIALFKIHPVLGTLWQTALRTSRDPLALTAQYAAHIGSRGTVSPVSAEAKHLAWRIRLLANVLVERLTDQARMALSESLLDRLYAVSRDVRMPDATSTEVGLRWEDAFTALAAKVDEVLLRWKDSEPVQDDPAVFEEPAATGTLPPTVGSDAPATADDGTSAVVEPVDESPPLAVTADAQLDAALRQLPDFETLYADPALLHAALTATPTAENPPLLVRALWSVVGADTDAAMTAVLSQLWVIEYGTGDASAWQVTIPAGAESVGFSLLSPACAHQAIRLAVAAHAATALAMTTQTDLAWLRTLLMSGLTVPDQSTVNVWLPPQFTPEQFHTLVADVVNQLRAALSLPESGGVDEPGSGTAAGPAGALPPPVIDRADVLRYRVDILAQHRPPLVTDDVVRGLRALPPALGLRLLSVNDAALMARDLRATLGHPDHDGVSVIVKVLWASLGALRRADEPKLAQVWRDEVAARAAEGNHITPAEFPDGQPISCSAMDGELLNAALVVGLTFTIAHEWGPLNRANLDLVRMALDEHAPLHDIRTLAQLLALPIPEIMQRVLGELPTPEIGEDPQKAALDPTVLLGVWPSPIIMTTLNGTRWVDAFVEIFKTRWRENNTGVNPPAAKVTEFKAWLRGQEPVIVVQYLFRALAEAMMARHPHADFRNVRHLDVRTELNHPFVLEDGRTRAGARKLSLRSVAELYWEFITAVPEYQFLRENFDALSIKLDVMVEHLFGVARYGRRRVSQLSRGALEATAREWGIERLLPLFAHDQVALSKLLNTKLFADAWQRLSDIERVRIVEGFSQLPLGQGEIAGTPHARTRRATPAELAQREQLFMDFLRARQTQLKKLGGADIYRLAEVYRYLTHLRFERDYDAAMRELEYRLGVSVDATGTVPAETDETLQTIYSWAHRYYRLKRRFGADPQAMRPGTLRNVHRIGAQFLTEPIEQDAAVDPDFALDAGVKFLLDERRIGKTRQLFAAWEKLRERGDIEADGAMLYVTRARNMEEVAGEIELIYTAAGKPSYGILQWRSPEERETVPFSVAGQRVRIVHYQNFWLLNPAVREAELARLQAQAGELSTQMDAAVKAGRGESEEYTQLAAERATVQGKADRLADRLPLIRRQWEALLDGVAVMCVDEGQEAMNPDEKVNQAQTVRDALRQLRLQRAQQDGSTLRFWLASASLYHSEPKHIRSMLAVCFPDHKAFADPAVFAAMYMHTLEGMMQLHIDLALFSLRRRLAEVNELGIDMPRVREIPHTELGEYTLSAEQIRILRAMFRNFRRWAEAYNVSAPRNRRIDLRLLNPLQIFGALNQVVQLQALVGGTEQSPMITEALRIAQTYRQQGKKVAIVGQYREVLAACEQAFADNGVATRRFDGTVTGWADGTYAYDGRRLVEDPAGFRVSRGALSLNQFNYGDTDSVLLANLQSVMAGLRVEADVIILADVPPTWTRVYQVMGRHQNPGTGKAEVDVVTMVGTYPPQFLDGLYDPHEIAQFECGSVGELKLGYLFDMRVIWELILNGEIDERGMKRLLERGFLSAIPGLLEQVETRADSSGKKEVMPRQLMRELWPLWDMATTPALSYEVIVRRQRLVLRLSQLFAQSDISPVRLASVLRRLMNRADVIFDFEDLEWITELFQTSDRDARDQLLRRLPRALTSADRAGRNFFAPLRESGLAGTPLAMLAIPMVMAGRLWDHPDGHPAVRVMHGLVAQLNARRDDSAQRVAAESVLSSLAQLVRADDMQDSTALARPTLAALLQHHASVLTDDSGTTFDQQLALLSHLAALATLNPALYRVLLQRGTRETFASADALLTWAMGYNIDSGRMIDVLGTREISPPLLQAFAGRWGGFNPVLHHTARLEALDRQVRSADEPAKAARVDMLRARYVEIMRSDVVGDYAVRRAGMDAAWEIGEPITYLAHDEHSTARFWTPWLTPHTVHVPERIVGRTDMLDLLRREYLRLVDTAHGLSAAVVTELEGTWTATQWQLYRDAEFRGERDAFRETVQRDRRQLAGFLPKRGRTITISEAQRAVLARFDITPPASFTDAAVAAYHAVLLSRQDELDRLFDWIEISRTLHDIFHGTAAANPAAALRALREKIGDLEARLQHNLLAARHERIVDQLRQLRRQVAAIGAVEHMEGQRTVLREITVTKETPLTLVHQLGDIDDDLTNRYRPDGSPVHLADLIHIAGSKNAELVVARSQGRIMAVALATVEQQQRGSTDADDNAVLFLDWPWFRGGYDFRHEMLQLLQEVARTMSYKLPKKPRRTPAVASPLPVTEAERKSISSKKILTVRSSGSSTGDRTVEHFSRLQRGALAHQAMIVHESEHR